MFWPSGLAVLYPYDQSPSIWAAAAAAAVVTGISVVVIRAWRSRPYLAVGWLWYVGTLVPVIGVVQVGLQSRADRYMYIPMIGLLLMLAWGAVDIVAKWPAMRLPLVAASGISIAACLALAQAQTEYWQNSETLFERAIAATHNNAVAEYNLGNYLMNIHRGAEAIPHFEAAIRTKPDYAEAENNLGMVLGNMPGRMPEAISHFEAAIRVRPNLLEAQYNLAVALAQSGRISEAIARYETIQKMQPSPEIAKVIDDLRSRRK
jgi:tetratricopeptide (TPR) repeat protein